MRPLADKSRCSARQSIEEPSQFFPRWQKKIKGARETERDRDEKKRKVKRESPKRVIDCVHRSGRLTLYNTKEWEPHLLTTIVAATSAGRSLLTRRGSEIEMESTDKRPRRTTGTPQWRPAFHLQWRPQQSSHRSPLVQ